MVNDNVVVEKKYSCFLILYLLYTENSTNLLLDLINQTNLVFVFEDVFLLPKIYKAVTQFLAIEMKGIS